jgi:hypothetical protein
MSSIIKVDTVQDQDGNNIINENANVITVGASGDTITIPAGATLVNNGTATGFFEGIAWQSITTAATLTTVAGRGYPINTTSNACTVTLPSSASAGDQIQIVDYAGTFATNKITLNSSLKIEGATDDKLLTTNREGVIITYVDVTQGWVATTGVNSGNQALDPAPYSIDFLVVAGGGGSGGGTPAQAGGSGGGGGGGMRTYTKTASAIGIVVTITVGDGGSGNTGLNPGSQGSNSSISGTGLTTTTSAGGGYSTYQGGAAAGSGGSGGGESWAATPAGSGNTPSTTPSQGADGGSITAQTGGGGGGGGGASGVIGGNTVATNTGGAGGNGTTSSITGSSTSYAGGGGGGSYGGGGGVSTSGGLGGGGNGSANATSGANGTVNLGGGSGGAGTNTGGSGGKGVVILSLPTASYSGTTTGSPTEATSGANKILTFTGTGSYTT